MNSNLIIQKIHSAFEGEFNPGFIKGKGARHSDCFVYYVYGNANYIFENCTLNVSEGTGFYISKSSVYDIKINEKSKYICIDFEFQQSDRTRRSLSFGNVGVGISNLFSRFLHIRFAEDRDNLPKAFSLLYEIYFELLKKTNEKYSRYADFDAITEFVLDNYTSPDISIAAIAKGSGFSESQVRRMFKAKLRVTPIKYINYLRLEKAKKMLTESNFSVSEIAFATGFEDQFYFSRIFKKQYGISPLSYRFENQHK